MIEQHKPSAPVSQLHALDLPPEQPIDVGRYANALRRSKLLIVAIVVAVTAIVLVMSLLLPKTYSAGATILFDEGQSITTTTDAERQLATIQKLLVTRDVLRRSARRLPGESVSSLTGKVQASVDPTANIVTITASASSPERAARIANVVAAAFLARERAGQLTQIRSAEAKLKAAIAGLKGTPGGPAQIALIRERLSELSVSEATAGSQLQLADPAHPPSRADSPRPVRNAAFAFVAALFIAMLVALGRERVAPRIGEPRELERLSGYPILTEIPKARRHFRDPQAALRERDSYDALAAVVAAQLPPRRRHILMLTSPSADEAKARVTAGLSRALAQAGETALVVDADLRRPALEQLFGMEPAPGLAEILAAARQGDAEAAGEMIVEPAASASSRRTGSLAVLGAGEAASPALVTADALDVLFGELAQSGFTCVVFNGPPLLGYPECRSWARHVDAVLVVSRPDRLHPSDAVELRNQLDLVDTPVLGHVVIGGGS
ncbi:MAG TPA: Wzz/FepE/Etk N-terminal domain-containing protein [Gaiellaceae bacterium]|nr:Wzz/FepE/Etk N-terminal domain-containing protein [Gaiellaceae bacterium]